jgi:GTPase
MTSKRYNIMLTDRQMNPLKKENDLGNVEYKWKLMNLNPLKKEKILTQMKHRLFEGNGKAQYFLGIMDDGTPRGLDEHKLNLSLITVLEIITKLEGKIDKIRIFKANDGFCAMVNISTEQEFNLW